MKRIAIIGNGIAANTAASYIRKVDRGVEIVVFSKDPHPLYSPCILPNYLGREIEREKVFLKGTTDYEKQGIRVFLGKHVHRIDPDEKKIEFEDRELPYDMLILATGSRPLIPPIRGAQRDGVFTFKTLDDVERAINFGGTRALVVGSGPVGVEVAIALRRRKYTVYLVEMADWLMPQVFDREPSLLVHNLLEEREINVITGEKVVEFRGSGSAVDKAITTKREIPCDMVIMAAGMAPDVDLASSAGIKIGKLGGIRTNRKMLTDVPDVYACGDCAQSKDRLTGDESLSLLWHNAKKQGQIAGLNAAGARRSYPGSMDITVVDLFGTRAVSMGRTLQGLKGAQEDVIERRIMGDYYRLIFSERRLIGVQMIGRRGDTGMLLNMMSRKDDPSRLVRDLSGGIHPGRKIGWQGRVMGHWKRYLDNPRAIGGTPAN
ncbi:MAG: NAD(P)/FAD-dependent oxidoreductase [Deltaproteobacteria bacterium]|nr:NAD(P)/FAD-dependent oxidoreductase [Deltaproteobacteria bacterium]